MIADAADQVPVQALIEHRQGRFTHAHQIAKSFGVPFQTGTARYRLHHAIVLQLDDGTYLAPEAAPLAVGQSCRSRTAP